ncbi:MAG: rRNA cytosine-C5-methyltransferase [Paludibacteraceae bacterium]|nr:rRNA cytosine-C5-methyltransferase [Paludibacteraceae bacterium]
MELPIAFIEQMKALLPTEHEQFFEAMQTASPVSVRLNDKSNITPLYNKVPHCDSGFYLPERPVFTLDPWFHAGVYYVQEAGSMYLEQVIKRYLSNPSTTYSKAKLHAIRALDLCAAPGGKSTHLSSLLSDDSLLISNEVMPQRAHILAENTTKWGYGNVAVTNNRPADFGKLAGYFDLMLTDVPCSGEGMFRKDEKAIEDWSAHYVLECAERQRNILTDVWPALKQGGLLIYSTCTFNKAENEDNIQWIAQELGADILESRHFYFHTDQSEGLFMAALRKTAPAGNTRIKSKAENQKPKKSTSRSTDAPIHQKESALLNSDNWCIKEEKDLIYALPKAYEADFSLLDKHLRWVKKGIGIATLKGKNQTPHIDLALSRHINKDAFTTYDLDLTTALHYLKGESITLPDAPIGYLLLTYRGVPIGWGKNIGNRCNNLYPDAWRIRMNISDTPCTLPF